MIKLDHTISVARIDSRALKLATKELSWFKKPQVHYWMVAIPLMLIYSYTSFFNYGLIALPFLVVSLLALGFFYVNPKLKKLMPKKYYSDQDNFFTHWMNNDVKKKEIKEFYSHLQLNNLLSGKTKKDINKVKNLIQEYSTQDSDHKKRKVRLLAVSFGILGLFWQEAFAQLISNESNVLQITIIGIPLMISLVVSALLISSAVQSVENFREGHNAKKAKQNLKLLIELQEHLLNEK